MNINVNISMLKRQLNIEDDWTGDDAILQYDIDIAKGAVMDYIGSTALDSYTGNTAPDAVIHSVILLATNFYINRNMISFAQGVELPYSFKFLLGPYKNYPIS